MVTDTIKKVANAILDAGEGCQSGLVYVDPVEAAKAAIAALSTEERSYIAGFNDGWEAANGEPPEAGLSSDAEPVAWVDEQELRYLEMVTGNKAWGDAQRSIKVGGKKEGRSPLYAAPPAPSVGVKAVKYNELLVVMHPEFPPHVWDGKIMKRFDEKEATPPAPSVAVKAPFEFDRYINGVLMAEGVRVDRIDTLEKAMAIAAKIASRGPNGETPVLVLRASVSPKVGDEAEIRLKAIEDVLSALTAHELYQYRPKAFQGFIDYARTELSAPVSALSAQVQDVSGWHDISTAPKDGTPVILWTVWVGDEISPDPFSEVQIGYWDEGNDLPEGHDFSRKPEWTVQRIGEPTHWMPLPAAPAAKLEEKP